MLALSLVLAAAAGDLSLRYEAGAPVRYHAESLFSAGGVPMIARQNLEARAVKLGVTLDLSCVPAAARKGWQLTCDVESARLQGQAVSGDQEKLDRVLAESAASLAEGTLVVDVAADGRVTGVALRGLPTDDEREAQIAEVLRQVCRRALAPLDVELPKDGVNPGKPWKQGGTPLAAELFVNAVPIWSGAGSTATPVAAGVAGGLSLKHAVTAVDAAGLRFSTEGKGNVTALVTDSNTYYAHVEIGGQGRFDPAAGQIAYATLTVTAADSASASVRSLADGYTQSGWIARWNTDGSLEGPDGVIKAETAEAPAAPEAPAATGP